MNVTPTVTPTATPEHAGGQERAEERPTKAHVVDLSALFPNDLYLKGSSTQGKRVALTFDDAPDTRFTPQVLDMLKSLEVKATFFVVGQRVDAHPWFMKRIFREGHAYGNHTYNHANLTKLTPAQVRREVQACERAIARVTGHRTRLFRPPYGALTPATVRELVSMGYKIIYWNVDSLDWMGLSGPQVTANILSHTGPGDIILQHGAGGKGENLSGSVASIPYVVETLRKQEYEFVTIPQLLGIKDWEQPAEERLE